MNRTRTQIAHAMCKTMAAAKIGFKSVGMTQEKAVANILWIYRFIDEYANDGWFTKPSADNVILMYYNKRIPNIHPEIVCQYFNEVEVREIIKAGEEWLTKLWEQQETITEQDKKVIEKSVFSLKGH